MKSSWEPYQGKRLFFAHYDHLNMQDLNIELGSAEKEILQQPTGSVLLLADVTGTIITPEVLNLFKNTALRTNSFLIKVAVLGVTGVRRAFMDIVAKFSGIRFQAFDDVQKAKDWLLDG